MNVIDVKLDADLVAYLDELLVDQPCADMMPVLIGPSLNSKIVTIGLYPSGEEKWSHALQLPSGIIRLSKPLADDVLNGKKMSLRKVFDSNDREKNEIWLTE